MNLNYYFSRALINVSEFLHSLAFKFGDLIYSVKGVADIYEKDFEEWEKKLTSKYPPLEDEAGPVTNPVEVVNPPTPLNPPEAK